MKRHLISASVLLIGFTLLALFLPENSSQVRAQGAGTITRVSVASGGVQANDGSSLNNAPSISADGRYIAFDSKASNLVPGDTNGDWDVFVYDRLTNQTTRVSLGPNGIQANGAGPSISADGRYVAFYSAATNLVIGDTNGKSDVFVYDRQLGQTTRVSVASNGTQGNGSSLVNSISADGRYVAFNSSANNLVAGDTNGTPGANIDVFVHDRQTGQTTRVSVASDGTQANGDVYASVNSISGDGRYVTFASLATTLVPNDTCCIWDVFVHDRQTGQTSRVSVAPNGAPANGDSFYYFGWGPSISANGRFVAFSSSASNLVQGINGGVFVYDRQTGLTTSVVPARYSGYNDQQRVSLSADGNYTVYAGSYGGAYSDIFTYDQRSGQITKVSVSFDGSQANNNSFRPAISADGQYAVFASNASNLVPGDTNGSTDVFVYERGPEPTPTPTASPTPTSTPKPVSTLISPGGGSLTSNDANHGITISFPPDAVTSSIVVTYAYQSPFSVYPLVGIDRFFYLSATQDGIPVLEFNKPVTLEIRYSNKEKGPAIASTLSLRWLSNTNWITEGVATVVNGNNIITSTTGHFTLFGVLGESNWAYLPVIRCNH